MSLDALSFLFGMACAGPVYLFLDRCVFPFAEWIGTELGGE